MKKVMAENVRELPKVTQLVSCRGGLGWLFCVIPSTSPLWQLKGSGWECPRG